MRTEISDDLFMILMHNKNIHVGDIVYYVTSKDGHQVIRKSRIARRDIVKRDGLSTDFDTYSYFCEDGYIFNTLSLFLPVFESITQAQEYVIRKLQCDIKRAELSLHNAQEYLGNLRRSLNVYQKAMRNG